jgi:hypothetical protein
MFFYFCHIIVDEANIKRNDRILLIFLSKWKFGLESTLQNQNPMITTCSVKFFYYLIKFVLH